MATPSGHALIFEPLPSIFWDPDQGGFLKRKYQLSFRSASLIDSHVVFNKKGKIKPGIDYPSSISHGELLIGPHHTFESPMGINTYKFRSASHQDRLIPGQPLGIVIPSMYSKRVYEPDVDARAYDETSLQIYLTKDLDGWIARNYSAFPESIIRMSATLILYKKETGRTLRSNGVIQINLLQSRVSKIERAAFTGQDDPNRKYSFAEDLFLQKSSIRAQEKDSSPVQSLQPTLDPRPLSIAVAASGKTTDLTFYSEEHPTPLIVGTPGIAVQGQKTRIGSSKATQQIPSSYQISPYTYLTLFKDYQSKQATDLTKTLYTDLIYASHEEGRGLGRLERIPFQASLPANLVTKPRYVHFTAPTGDRISKLSQDTESLTVQLAADESISQLTNFRLWVYHYRGTLGGSPDINGYRDLHMEIAASSPSLGPIRRNSRSLTFQINPEFKKKLQSLKSSGFVFFAISYQDPSGAEVSIATKDTTLMIRDVGQSPVVSRLSVQSVYDPIGVEGLNLVQPTGFAFEDIQIDVFYQHKIIGGPQAESFILDARRVLEYAQDRISFRIPASATLDAYLQAGRAATIRVALLKDGKEMYATQAYAALRGVRNSAREHIEGLELLSGPICRESTIEVSALRGLKTTQPGELVGLLFQAGHEPKDVLAVPDKRALVSQGLIGTVAFDDPSWTDRRGRERAQGTVSITNPAIAQDTSHVTLVILRAQNPGSRLGRFSSYGIIRMVPLASSFFKSHGVIQTEPHTPWTGIDSYDFYVYAGTYSNAAVTNMVGTPYLATGRAFANLYGNTESLGEYYVEMRPEYMQTTVSTHLGETWRIAGGRLVDNDYVKTRHQRYHGPAILEHSWVDPFSSSVQTSSVFIHREPILESIQGAKSSIINLDQYLPHGILTFSGTGFSSDVLVRTQSDGSSVFQSAVIGLTYYDRETKNSVSDLPYTTEVIKYPDGREEFAFSVIGAAPTALISSSGTAYRDGYFVVSTDWGSDWYKAAFYTSTASSLYYYHGDPALSVKGSQTINGGARRKAYVNHLKAWGTGGYRTTLRWQDALVAPTKIQDVTTYVGHYLEYTGSNIAEILYIPMAYSTSIATWTGASSFTFNSAIYFSLESLSASFPSTYYEQFTLSSVATVYDAELTWLGFHPGTSRAKAGSFVGRNLSNPNNFAAQQITWSGISFTQTPGFRATHRADYYEIFGTLATSSNMFFNPNDAFYAADTTTNSLELPSTPNYHSITAGGICVFHGYNGLGMTNRMRWYMIGDESENIVSTMESYGNVPFQQLGSYGSSVWGLGKDTSTGSRAQFLVRESIYAVPGACNTPFGLYSMDTERKVIAGGVTPKKRALVQGNLLGKPKVSVQASDSQFRYSPFVRWDTPFESVVRPPMKHPGTLRRDILDGNAISPFWKASNFARFEDEAYESFIPLVYNHNAGSEHLAKNDQVVGNALRAKVEYLDSTTPFFTEDPLKSQTFHGSSAPKMIQYAVPVRPTLDSASHLSHISGWPHRMQLSGMGVHEDHEVALSGVREIGIRRSVTSSSDLYDDEVYGTGLRDWSRGRFYRYPYQAWMYAASDTRSTTISSTQLLGLIGHDGTLGTHHIFSSFQGQPVQIRGGRTLMSPQVEIHNGSIDLSGASYAFQLTNGLRSVPRGRAESPDYTFPYLAGQSAPTKISLLSPGFTASIHPNTGVYHAESQLPTGPMTVAVQPIAGTEFGFQDTFYPYSAAGHYEDYRASDAFFNPSSGLSPVQLSSTLALSTPVLVNNQEASITGIRRGPEQVRVVLVTRIHDGRTAPIPYLDVKSNRVVLKPKHLGDFFNNNDLVRIGVQYESGAIDLGLKEYAILETETTTHSNQVEVSVTPFMMAGEGPSRAHFQIDSQVDEIAWIAAAVPLTIESSMDQPVHTYAMITGQVEASNGIQYIQTNLTKVMSSYLVRGQTMNLIGIRADGSYLYTRSAPAQVQKPLSFGLGGQTELQMDYYPSPKLAPSYHDTVSGVSSLDQNNPKAVNSEFLFWSESVTYSGYDPFVSTSYVSTVSWPEAISYGAGLRIAGKHLILRKEEYDHSTPYTDLSALASLPNYDFLFDAALYVTSSGTQSTYFSAPYSPGSGWNRVGVDHFIQVKPVNRSWYRPIYSKNSQRHTLSDQTEWQELNLSVLPGDFYDTPPPITYGGFAVRGRLPTAPGYPTVDGIYDSDLANVHLQYIDLDTYWSLHTPYPRVDEHTRYEASGVTLSDAIYGSDHDIWPKSIARGLGQAVIRITGENLVGNLNYQYATLSSNGTEQRTFAHLEPVKVWLHHTASDTRIYATSSLDLNHSLWGHQGGNNSSRLYAFFELTTDSSVYQDIVYNTFSSQLTNITNVTYIPNGHYDLHIETKWAAGSQIYTLSTYSANAIYITSSPYMELIDPRISYLPNATFETADYNNQGATSSVELSAIAKPMVHAMVANYPYRATSVYSTALPYNHVVGNDIAPAYLSSGLTVSLLISNTVDNPDFNANGVTASCLTSSGYEVMMPMAAQWSLFDEYMAVDATMRLDRALVSYVRPLVFSGKLGPWNRNHSWVSTLTHSVDENVWSHYQLTDLFDSTADVNVGTASIQTYHRLLSEARFDFGIEITGSTHPHTTYNDLSSTVSATRGAYCYREGTVGYHSYMMPRLVHVAGHSARNIVNYHLGSSTGGGDPRIDWVLEHQGRRGISVYNGFTEIGPAFIPSGLQLRFGDSGTFMVPLGTSEFGHLYLAPYGTQLLISWVPSRQVRDLLGTLRTSGWIDTEVVFSKQSTSLASDYRSLRVGWTYWDTKATTGDSVANNPSYQDAVIYCLRMLKKGNELRAAFGANFSGTTYEVSHQEPLIYDKTLNQDWFILVGSAQYDQANNQSKVVLYGARERDMYIDPTHGDARSYSKPTSYNVLENGNFEE